MPKELLVLIYQLGLSAAIGPIFVMLIQPHRTRLNGWASLLFAACGFWAYFSMARVVPEFSPLTEHQNFHLEILGQVLTPIALYVFATALCKPQDRLAAGLALWSGPAALLAVILLATGLALEYHSKTDTFTLHLPGVILIVNAVLYGLFALLHLRYRSGKQEGWLQYPAALLLIACLSGLAEPVRSAGLDVLLATVASIWIGYTLLHWQLFNRIEETDQRLESVKVDLRTALKDSAQEKEHSRQLEEDLREASRYKSEFLANMGHELRTPLNSIVGYSELLQKEIYGPLTSQQADRIEKIHRNGHSLLELINDVLDLSKIEGGRMELNLTPVRLLALTRGLVASLEPQAAAKALDIELDTDYPLRLIRADELRVRQILLNLLTHAIQTTQSGFIKLVGRNVTVRDGKSNEFPMPVIGWLSDRHWVVLSIQDTGAGIAPEDQANIFDEFHASRNGEGIGLGLAVARRLVELHSGRIWVRSKPGEGSTFYIALPAMDTFDQPTDQTDPMPKRASTILMISPNDSSAGALKTPLRSANYRVIRAEEAETGLARIHELQPKAILVDALMPGLEPWDVLRRLQKDPTASTIPIWLVSYLDNQLSGFALGESTCVAKPMLHDELLTGLAKVQGQKIGPVLVVDDMEADRLMLAEFLTNEGLPAVACGSGREALDWLKTNVPALVILDLVMPDVTGFEVLCALRSESRLAQIPVLLLYAAETDPEAMREQVENVVRLHHQTGFVGDLKASLA
jgi:signal transduction histidine kinase/DNA-binding response OmpR family regulator